MTNTPRGGDTIAAVLDRRAKAQSAEDAILARMPDAELLAAIEAEVGAESMKRLLHNLPVLAGAIADADVRGQVQAAVALMIGLPAQIGQARRIHDMKALQAAPQGQG